MSDPNHSIIYKSERPLFSIEIIKGTSTNRGYHETDFEVVSQHPIRDEHWAHLDAAGLLGIGQAYHITKREEIVVPGVPTKIDKRTGKQVPGPCTDWMGREATKPIEYTYYRYVVRRICDSGD